MKYGRKYYLDTVELDLPTILLDSEGAGGEGVKDGVVLEHLDVLGAGVGDLGGEDEILDAGDLSIRLAQLDLERRVCTSDGGNGCTGTSSSDGEECESLEEGEHDGQRRAGQADGYEMQVTGMMTEDESAMLFSGC